MRPSRRILRGTAAGFLALLTVSLLAPLVIIAGGAAMLLPVVRDLPDARIMESLPSRFQPTATTTRLFSWSAPDADGLRHPVLIDEITDPRAGGAGWASLDELPDAVTEAFLAAADPRFFSAEPPSLSSVWAEWRKTGIVQETLF